MLLILERGGQIMLAAGVGLGLVGTIATLPRALRVRRRAIALQSTIESNRAEIVAALETLAALQQETEQLLVPWRRLGRRLRHPLVVATVQWYLRRRAGV